jgi:hypothetical protein
MRLFRKRVSAPPDAFAPRMADAGQDVNEPQPQECLLQHAVGGHERCPGEECPFFERGECRLGELRVDIDTNPQLARFLLDLRARLAAREGWQPFRRLGRPGRR